MPPRALSRTSFALLATVLIHTAIARADPFTFGVIGDYGTNNTAERDVANLVKSWNPSFILTLGDNNYSSDPTSWDARVGQYFHQYIYNYQGTYGPGSPTRRFFPIIGNHDYDAGIQGYFNYFDLPGNERYYTYKHGPVEFFLLNSNSQESDGISKTSKQATWLQNAMANSSATWKIVALHHPPYSSGGSTTTVRWPFEEWGADVVMAGHAHNYERIHVGNIDYFVNGLGGASIAGFDTTIAGSQVRYNATHGAMKVIADDSFMRFQFINKSGEIIDDYTLGLAPAPLRKFWNTAITSGAWNVAAHWSPTGVPMAGQDCFVIHQDATNRTVNYVNPSGATTQYRSLTVESRSTGTMTLRQSQDTLSVLTLNIATTSGAQGTFDKSAGTLVADHVVNRGAFTHTGGVMQINRSFENAAGLAHIGGEHRWGAGAALTVTGGTVHLNTPATTDAASGLAVDVRTGGTLRLNAVQRLQSLTIANGGSLDIADNALILRSSAATQATDLARLEALVAEGITSSTVAGNPHTTVAIIANPGLAAFSGTPISAHDILIAFTWNGDANLDGVIDADDYFRIDTGMLSGKKGFANGDFNYDGRIDADDYFLIDSAFLFPTARTSSAADPTSVLNPEPSALSLWMIACLTGLRRATRRRRSATYPR